MLVISWIVFFFLVAWYSNNKHISLGFWGAFWLSLFLSLLIGFIIVLGSSPDEKILLTNQNVKKCPDCAELIKSEAIKCRFCGKTFDDQGAVPHSEQDSVQGIIAEPPVSNTAPTSYMRELLIIGAISFLFIVLIMAFLHSTLSN